MYKDFKGKFELLAEEETSRYKTGGGLLPGDYITIKKSCFTTVKLKDRPSQFFDKLKEIIGSDLPLKVSAIKSMRPETQHGLYGGAEAPTDYWVDVVQCATPALFVNPMTLPIEVLELQVPEGNNFSPDLPDAWKRKDTTTLKAEKAPKNEPERNLTTQHINNALGQSAKDGRSQIDTPVKYKESENFDINDNDLLVEAYKKVTISENNPNDDDGEFDLYGELTNAGVPSEDIDNHETDLYVKKTPESEKILSRYPYLSNVKTFRSETDGKVWYDVPFAFSRKGTSEDIDDVKEVEFNEFGQTMAQGETDYQQGVEDAKLHREFPDDFIKDSKNFDINDNDLLVEAYKEVRILEPDSSYRKDPFDLRTPDDYDVSEDTGTCLDCGGPMSSLEAEVDLACPACLKKEEKRIAVEAVESVDYSQMDLSEIASVVKRDWKKLYFGVVPYLNALFSMNSINDNYGADTGRSIVAYFLSNAAQWRGPIAKAVKLELNNRLKNA